MWEFLRSELQGVIPLDDAIAACAVTLANRFIESVQHVKGTARNTMNDMYVAATSLTAGIPLVTDDSQLQAFYREHGWTVSSGDNLYIASPVPSHDAEPWEAAPAQKRDRYANGPLNLRSHVDQTPPPAR